MYRKALALYLQKWDMNKLEAKDSGWSKDDVIEYVRKKMYTEVLNPTTKNNEDSD